MGRQRADVCEAVDAAAIIHAVSTVVQLHGKLHDGERKETVVPSVPNGVQAGSLDARWIKSGHSNAEGNCVELARLADGAIAVRNSRDPEGPALVYTPAEVAAFLAGAKDGEFDHLV